MEAEILCGSGKAVELYVDEGHGESARSALGPHVKGHVERIPRKGNAQAILRFRLEHGPDVL